jgi:hypothetical protein
MLMTTVHDISLYPSIPTDNIEIAHILDFDCYSDVIANNVKGTISIKQGILFSFTIKQ